MPSLSQPPVHVIRVGKAKQEGQSLESEPYLIVSTTSQYTWLYNDRGTGAHMDVSIWRPAPTDNTFSIVGDYAQSNYYDPAGTSLIVKAINDVAHSANIQTVVKQLEETKTLLDFRVIGTDFLQGASVSRPEPLNALQLKAEALAP